MSAGMQSSCLAYCIMSICLSFPATSVIIFILLFTPVTEHVHQHNFLLYITSLSINISQTCAAILEQFMHVPYDHEIQQNQSSSSINKHSSY